jgi:hypothetical protein
MRSRPAAGLALAVALFAASSPTAAGAQARYSPYATLGVGNLINSGAGGSIATSAAIFWQPGRVVGLGLELGYQRFGVAPQPHVIGTCPVTPPEQCTRPVAHHSDGHGQAWFVGPTLRVRARGGAVRPFVLVGLGLYGSHQRTAVEYRDGEGQVLADPGPGRSTSSGRGLGINGGLGLQWHPDAGRRIGWTVAVRRHAAIFGRDGGSSATWVRIQPRSASRSPEALNGEVAMNFPDSSF